MKHEWYNLIGNNPSYNYQYNGKELQSETGWNDYGWRQYMPEIGRWNGMDQLSETYYPTSPFAYVANNPISSFDVDGRWFNQDGSINTSGNSNGFVRTKPSFTSQYLGMNSQDGGGSTTFGETQWYKDIMAYLAQPETNYFQGFDFTKYGTLDPTPKRKYLKDQTNAYFGAIESVTQYQLDHSNWIDEYQGTMDLLGSMKEYFDSAGDHLGGFGYGTFAIDNLKTIKDVVEKFKNYNPSLGSAVGFISGTVGTSLKVEGDRFGQIMDIYKNAEYRYDQLHKTNPELHKGVTVNVNVVIGTNRGGYTNIMIYDISTHRYLSGGKIVHRN